MDSTLSLGIFGSAIVALGAFWPVKTIKHPVLSIKNWLFALGGAILFAFALLDYLFSNGSIFFVILEMLVIISSVLMMLNTKDEIDIWVISISGIALVIWSLFLFEGYSTIFFILGLVGIGLGYALDTGTLKRNIVLTAGSLLIAVFSYLGESWIFFWLNTFFAIFSMYHSVLLIKKR
jgi:hypothetical protein